MDNQPQAKPEKSTLFKKLALTAATAVASVAGFIGWDRYTGEKTQTVNVQGIEMIPSGVDFGTARLQIKPLGIDTEIPLKIPSPFPSQNIIVGDKGEQFLTGDISVESPSDGISRSFEVSASGIKIEPPVPQEITTRGHGWTQLPTVKEMRAADPSAPVMGGMM